MKKKLSILGSTGSIGLSVLKIIKKKKFLFDINLLSANKNYKLISRQINEFKPKYFVISDYKTYKKIKNKYYKKKVKIFNNFKSIESKNKSDITISAIPGIAGLYPTILLKENCP